MSSAIRFYCKSCTWEDSSRDNAFDHSQRPEHTVEEQSGNRCSNCYRIVTDVNINPQLGTCTFCDLNGEGPSE